MSTGRLTISLTDIVANWRVLDARTDCETAATIKADAYGLGVDRVAPALAEAGARHFFVAVAEEGVALRRILGPGPEISVYSGHMDGDTEMISGAGLVPMLNDADQMLRHTERLPGHAFGVQLDTGMNRLGMEPSEWAALREIALAQNPVLLMSHLACADEPDHPMNAAQRDAFLEMTDGTGVPRSLAATGGLLLGEDFQFDLTRPGIGLYGGLPFVDARPVVTLDLPVVQVRDLAPGETVGYGCTWTATAETRVATVSAGYADGLLRGLGGSVVLHAGNVTCPAIGRISMDLITVDVTAVAEVPPTLSILGLHQSVDSLADAADTIGYEILTALGRRYARRYVQ
jgi:alanine racemase